MNTRPRAVLYSRLSAESDRSTSIEGQDSDLAMIAEREGWEVVQVFVDEGESGGKQRAKALEALDMLRRGDGDILAVYAHDRYSRMGIGEDAEIIRVIKNRNAEAKRGNGSPALYWAEREGIRSDVEGWEIRLAFASDLAEKERLRTSSRQIAARKRMREQGRNPGLGVPPLGYRTGPHPTLATGRGYVVDEAEAEVVREVAERLTSGESTVTIAADLTARRFPRARSPYRVALIAYEQGDEVEPLLAARDVELTDEERRTLSDEEKLDRLDRGTWAAPRVRDTWTSEHLLGRVSHNGKSLLDPTTGEPLAPFEPILDLSTYLAIVHRFDRPRGQQRKRRAARLLSGVAYCGVCDTKQYVKHARGKAFYQCSAVAIGKSCPQPRIDAEALEAEVVRRYLAAWRNVPEWEVQEHYDDRQTAAQLAEVSARISEVSAALGEDDADVAAIVAQLDTLKTRRAELRAIEPTRSEEIVATGRTFGDVFADADVDAKRSLMQRVLDHVSVYPRGAAERVVCHWLDRSPFEPRADLV